VKASNKHHTLCWSNTNVNPFPSVAPIQVFTLFKNYDQLSLFFPSATVQASENMFPSIVTAEINMPPRKVFKKLAYMHNISLHPVRNPLFNPSKHTKKPVKDWDVLCDIKGCLQYKGAACVRSF